MSVNFSFDIKIVYDNKCVNEGFLPGFGFSALIYNSFTENYILFDTGGNSRTLIHNINKFNINISEIAKVIISHNHGDHAGGLDGIYDLNPNIAIFIPIAHQKAYQRNFKSTNVVGVSELKEIEPNVIISGQFGGLYTKEQCLFLKLRSNEIIIMVGCAHPGLEQFILKARDLGDIKAIIGGFHGFNKFSYLENVEFIGACHCTQYVNAIKKQFPKEYRKICVGDFFRF
jgi:7,8-dihydropterin-6-yl-methyl-4-(beta-D-ribofuranosyl)aminobenzene 5'-phosphate synthase